MQTRSFAALILFPGLLALAGCASTGDTVARADDPSPAGATKLAMYQAAAGEPVTSFNYRRRINSWLPLDDRNLAVWNRPNEAFLLTLDGPCRDLDVTPTISLTNSGGRVSARFDSVMVHTRSSQIPCRIQEIRPLDLARLK